MRFLADESCDFSVVRALRNAGHDVVAVAEISAGADDANVIERSVRESRVLLTEDKDFGQLVYASARMGAGVILIRFPGNARAMLAAAIVQLVSRKGDHLTGRFAVVQPGQTRIT